MKEVSDPRTPSLSRSALYCMAAVLAILCAATVCIDYPGHWSKDSVTQLSEGVSGVYSSFNPPFMGFLLGLFNGLSPGVPLFFLADIAIFYAACFLLLAGTGRHWCWSLVFIIPVCLGPVILIYNGVIWKDVFLANVALLAFATMANDAPLSRGRIAVVILAVSAAVLIRQQGLLIALVAAWCLGYSAGMSTFTKRLWKTLEYFLMILIVSQLTLLIVQLSSSSIHGESYGTGLNILYSYDIAGITYRGGPSLLTVFSDFGIDVEEFTEEVRQHYSASRVDSLNLNIPFGGSLLLKQWVAAISAAPGAYLAHRSEVFLWLLGWYGTTQCAPVYVGVEGSPEQLSQLGIAQIDPYKLDFLWAYGGAVSQSLLFQPIAYFAVAIALLPWLWRRRAYGLDRALAMLLITAILYECSYFVIAIACDFRYSYFLVVSATATLAVRGPAMWCSFLETLKSRASKEL